MKGWLLIHERFDSVITSTMTQTGILYQLHTYTSAYYKYNGIV